MIKNIELTDKTVTEKSGGLCISYIIRIDGNEIGECSLRVGDPLEPYRGNVGYRIEKAYRGHRYSLSALEKLKAEALALSLDRLIICCDPDNEASRRIAELSGAEFLGVIDIPHDCELFAYGKKLSCRYRLPIK